jgi:uridine kinase
MSCVLLLAGLPGAGKTTLAKSLTQQLASVYDITVIHYDDYLAVRVVMVALCKYWFQSGCGGK